MPAKQRTVAREARLAGRGLFTGEEAELTLSPAAPDAGITFVRQTDAKTAVIPAHVSHVAKTPRRTALRNGTLRVETVEHCMAALAGLGVTNATLKVTGGTSGEVPMGDGSSRAFVDLIREAGLETQDDAPDVQPIVIERPIHVGHGGATLTALPGPTDRLEILYQFDAPPPVGRQVFTYDLPLDADPDTDPFDDLLAPARTFVFEDEARQLAAHGIGAHLTPRDVLVIGRDGPLDGNSFRWPDEPVRHKVLDLIGDLRLAGRPIVGRVIAHKSGHELNHLLARRLLAQEAHRDRAALLNRPESAMDVRRIQRILPHRFPMLLVDRVLEIEGDERAVGVKNVTMGEPFFQGHYPGTPIFPGVLIVEAMAQLGGILLSRKLEHTGKLAVLLSMDRVKMRHAVVPGDQLLLEARAIRVKSRTGHMRCQAFVGDKLAAEADIKFMLVDAEPNA